MGELEVIEAMRRALGEGPLGEHWIGDDSAVLDVRSISELLFAADVIVEGVHFDRSFSSLVDVGFKALVVNVSDMAAMGGRPRAAVVTVAGADGEGLGQLHQGLLEASRLYDCPVVGGDISGAGELAISVAIIGVCPGGNPVVRSGAKGGDHVFLTGALGRAAAGLRALRASADACGPHVESHRRPMARVEEAEAARFSGATAMIDVSDGFGLDLSRLLDASGKGANIEALPVAPEASFEEALSGGEDFELLFTAPDREAVKRTFEGRNLPPPILIGQVQEKPSVRLLAGKPLLALGYRHDLDNH